MSLTLISVGNKPPSWVQTGCEEYIKRLPKVWRFQERLLAQSRARDIPTRSAEEGKAVLATVPEKAVLIILDERGREHDSEAFAEALRVQLESGRDLVLALGGPHGHDGRVRERAEHSWSLSRMTLPHPLARLMLLEQLYRAHARFENHPYHSA